MDSRKLYDHPRWKARGMDVYCPIAEGGSSSVEGSAAEVHLVAAAMKVHLNDAQEQCIVSAGTAGTLQVLQSGVQMHYIDPVTETSFCHNTDMNRKLLYS